VAATAIRATIYYMSLEFAGLVIGDRYGLVSCVDHDFGLVKLDVMIGARHDVIDTGALTWQRPHRAGFPYPRMAV